MRSIIGAYPSLEAAHSAVRALESQLSVQNVVVRDERGRGSRAQDGSHANFIVSMSGTAANIEQARALLHAKLER